MKKDDRSVYMQIDHNRQQNDNKDSKDIKININFQYEKIFMLHIDQITCLENTQFWTQLISIFTFAVFLTMATIKAQYSNSSFLYVYLLIPACITVIAMTIWANCYLKLKGIFDKAHEIVKEEAHESCSFGTFISYVCLNLISACTLTYIILLTIKLDHFPGLAYAGFNLIAIPFYILVGIAVFYFIFILPAFIQNKLYFCLSVLGVYIVSTFLTLLMLSMKLDGSLKESFILIFTPLLVSMTLHTAHAIWKIITESWDNFVYNIFNSIGVVLISVGTIFISVKADSNFDIPNYLPGVIYLIAFLFMIDYRIFICSDDKDES